MTVKMIRDAHPTTSRLTSLVSLLTSSPASSWFPVGGRMGVADGTDGTDGTEKDGADGEKDGADGEKDGADGGMGA